MGGTHTRTLRILNRARLGSFHFRLVDDLRVYVSIMMTLKIISTVHLRLGNGYLHCIPGE